jgi:hypothetical protein
LLGGGAGTPAHEIGITAARPLVGPLGQSVLVGRIAPFAFVMQQHPSPETCAVHLASACSRRSTTWRQRQRQRQQRNRADAAPSIYTRLDKHGDDVLRKHSWDIGRMIAVPLIAASCTSRLTRQHGKHGSATTSLLGLRRTCYTQPRPVALVC